MALLVKTLDVARADFKEQQMLVAKNRMRKYSRFATEVNSRLEYEKFATLSGLPLPLPSPEGRKVIEGVARKLYNKSWSVTKYGQRIRYSYEAKFTDQYGIFPQLGKQVAQRAEDNIEYLFASFLANATNSGAAFLGADGVAWASAAHPTNGGPTFSNTSSSSLSLNPANINAAKAQVRRVLDPNGVPFGYTGDWLLVTVPELEYTAKEIMRSATIAYSADRTANTQTEYMVAEPVILDFWTSTTTAWALIPSSKEDHGIFKMNRMPRLTEFDTDKQAQAEFIICTEENVFGWTHSYNTYYNPGL